VGFDPDAFLGAAPAKPAPVAAPAGGFDPDAFVGAPAEAPAAPAPEPSGIEAAARGLKQGATLGFGDELTGAIESLFSDKTYRQARDEARANDKAAQAAHPLLYGAGELGGGVATSFIPGLGIAKGAGALATAGKAALTGAISGVGNSEKEDIGGLAEDAAASGALSGVTAGVLGKVVRGAPERVEKRLLGNITEGATATQRDRVVGRAGSKAAEVLEAIKGDRAIAKAGDNPHQLLPAIENAIENTGQGLDKAIDRGAPILVSDVLGKVENVAQKLAGDPGKADAARAVMSKANDVLEAWGNRTHVTPQEVRVLAKDIGDAAFRGSPAVAPKQAQAVGRQVWGELKDLLSESVQRGGGSAKEVDALNKRMSSLLSMRDAVAYRATRESTPSTTLSSRLGGALDLGLAFADPTAFAAKKAYDFVGKPALRAADTKLAQLVMAARNGSAPAQIAQMAVELGLGRQTGDMVAQWAVSKFGGAQAQPAGEPPAY
jgi:hypothetical protein